MANINNRELEEALMEEALIDEYINEAYDEELEDDIKDYEYYEDEEVLNNSLEDEAPNPTLNDSEESIQEAKNNINNLAENINESAETIDKATETLEEHIDMISKEQKDLSEILLNSLETHGGQLILKDEMKQLKGLAKAVDLGATLTVDNLNVPYLETLYSINQNDKKVNETVAINEDKNNEGKESLTKEKIEEYLKAGEECKKQYRQQHNIFKSISASLKRKSMEAFEFAKRIGKTISVTSAQTYEQTLTTVAEKGQIIANKATEVKDSLDNVKENVIQTKDLALEKTKTFGSEALNVLNKSYTISKNAIFNALNKTHDAINNARIYQASYSADVKNANGLKLMNKKDNYNMAKKNLEYLTKHIELSASVKVTITNTIRKAAHYPELSDTEKDQIRLNEFIKKASKIKEYENKFAKYGKSLNAQKLKQYERSYKKISNMRQNNDTYKQQKLNNLMAKINQFKDEVAFQEEYSKFINDCSSEELAKLYSINANTERVNMIMQNEDKFVADIKISIDDKTALKKLLPKVVGHNVTYKAALPYSNQEREILGTLDRFGETLNQIEDANNIHLMAYNKEVYDTITKLLNNNNIGYKINLTSTANEIIKGDIQKEEKENIKNKDDNSMVL